MEKFIKYSVFVTVFFKFFYWCIFKDHLFCKQFHVQVPRATPWSVLAPPGGGAKNTLGGAFKFLFFMACLQYHPIIPSRILCSPLNLITFFIYFCKQHYYLTLFPGEFLEREIIAQSINTGSDVSNIQFDLQVPFVVLFNFERIYHPQYYQFQGDNVNYLHSEQ